MLSFISNEIMIRFPTAIFRNEDTPCDQPTAFLCSSLTRNSIPYACSHVKYAKSRKVMSNDNVTMDLVPK